MIERPIPLFSSEAANRGLDLAGAIQRVLASNSFVMGREVAQFEQEFAAYCGVAECVSLGNGTDALELALRALEIPPGAAVACVGNAGFYSTTAIHLAGARPLYVEVDEATLTMSADALARALERKPAAVIATHLYGRLADIERIAQRCRDAGVPLVEDCAQSHGARRDGRLAGSFGDIGCFSFYPTKNLGALGDGGAVVTSNAALAARVRSLRQYGWGRKYEVLHLGGRNSRLDEMQAALLREKLPHLDRHNAARQAIARAYAQGLAGLPLRLPDASADDYVAHLYVVRTERREALREHLRARGIATDVHYPIADIRQPAFADAFAGESLPVTQAACASVVSLPCYPGLPDADVQQVVAAVREFFRAGP